MTTTPTYTHKTSAGLLARILTTDLLDNEGRTTLIAVREDDDYERLSRTTPDLTAGNHGPLTPLPAREHWDVVFYDNLTLGFDAPNALQAPETGLGAHALGRIRAIFEDGELIGAEVLK